MLAKSCPRGRLSVVGRSWSTSRGTGQELRRDRGRQYFWVTCKRDASPLRSPVLKLRLISVPGFPLLNLSLPQTPAFSDSYLQMQAQAVRSPTTRLQVWMNPQAWDLIDANLPLRQRSRQSRVCRPCRLYYKPGLDVSCT